MIEVYKRENADYEKNGDMTLFPESCTVTAELNGAWCMEITHPLDEEERWKYITEEAVIAVPTFMGRKQLFRVDEVEKTDTEVTAKAYPIFFDSADDCFLMDVRPTGKTGQQALNEMTAGSRYSGRSNIGSGATAYFVRRNLMDAINGEESPTFIEHWGGEILYDNHTVIINDRVGADHGVEVRYGKNMTAIRYHVDMSEVVTRIVPVAYNGRTMSTPGHVDSVNIEKYAKIYTKEMIFEHIKLAEDTEGEEEDDVILCKNQHELDTALQEACKEQYASGLDLPAVTLEIDLAELSDTAEYEEFHSLEAIALGDTVYCHNRNLDISTKARAIQIVWDCIYNEIQAVTLGNYERNYFRDVTSSTAKIEHVTADDGSLMAERVRGILNGMQTQLRLQNTAAEKQKVRAVLFEDLDPDSELYGALSIGTQGWQIARTRTEDGRDWDWKTAATAKGIVADAVITGILSDRKGRNFWDLDTGEFSLSSTAEIGEGTVADQIKKAMDGLTQEEMLKRLTRNGASKGIYLKDGQLYILFTYAKGGAVTLGGINNENGYIDMLGANGEKIGGWGKDHFFIGDYFYVNDRGMVSKDQNFSNTYAGFLNLEHSAVFDDETQDVYVTLNNVDAGDKKDIGIVVTAQYRRDIKDGYEIFYQTTPVGYGITISESGISVTRVDPGNPQYVDTITGTFDSVSRTAVIMLPGKLINSYTPYREGDHIYDADGKEIFKETGNSLDSIGSSAFSEYAAAEIKSVEIRKGNEVIAENAGRVTAISGMSIDTIEKKITGGGFELTPDELKCVGDFSIHLVRSLNDQTDVFRVTKGGMYHSGLATSSSGSTLVLSAGNILQKTSSSMRYKNTVRPISETPECDPEKLYDIDVVTFRYNDGYIPDTDQRYQKDIPGFIADDIFEKYRIACDLDEEGRPEMWNIHILFPAALKLVQDQHKELEELKTRVATLEKEVKNILKGGAA